MIKRYCDSCGKEVQSNVCYERIKGPPVVNGAYINFEIMVGVGRGVVSSGDLCANCLLEAINICYRNLSVTQPQKGQDSSAGKPQVGECIISANTNN
jgi:hypothetical protein